MDAAQLADLTAVVAALVRGRLPKGATDAQQRMVANAVVAELGLAEIKIGRAIYAGHRRIAALQRRQPSAAVKVFT